MSTGQQRQDPLVSKQTAQIGGANAVAALVTSGVCGLVFGITLQKARVFEPEHILGQLRFTHFFMIKMFLAAAAGSLVSTALLSLTSIGRSRIAGARKWCFNSYRGMYAAALGGALLGVGMALAGACPGTVLLQVGSGVKWSLYTVAGAFLGAAVFAAAEPTLLRPTGMLNAKCFPKNPTLDTLLNTRFVNVAVPMAVLFGVISLGVEFFVPWRAELAAESVAVPASWMSLSSYAWPPVFCGILVGLLQIPMMLLAGETLGASRAYVTGVAQVASKVAPKYVASNGYLTGAKDGVANWSQLIFVICATVGAFVSATAAGGFGTVSGFSPLKSLLGGFCVVFGGRLAGGCTSGQGLSGNAVLGLISPVVTAMIFVGGIATALLLR